MQDLRRISNRTIKKNNQQFKAEVCCVIHLDNRGHCSVPPISQYFFKNHFAQRKATESLGCKCLLSLENIGKWKTLLWKGINKRIKINKTEDND